MKNKKILFILGFVLILSIAIYFIFFNNQMSKNWKMGNNSTSQEMVEQILNISSYETQIEVEVISNKNSNKYKIIQKCESEEYSMQEVIEPTNIAGIKIIKEGNKLTLENTNLNLSTVYENYQYIADNNLDLNCFIKDYKNDDKAQWQEDENQIKMLTSKERIKKTLYVDKQTGTPIKMEVKDNNTNIRVYILYNKADIKNSTKHT